MTQVTLECKTISISSYLKNLIIFILLMLTTNVVYAISLEDSFDDIILRGKKPVIILIDLQESYDFSKTGRLQNVIDLVNKAQENKARLIQINYGKSPTEATLRSQLLRRRYEYYLKEARDAFTPLTCTTRPCWNRTTSLDELLNSETDEIILAGVSDACCVLKTAKSALERGFKVHLSRGEKDGNAYLWKRLEDDYPEKLTIVSSKPCQW
ncbi:isochorismatase family protein [Pseudoalteromonas sp. NBT06-2]|uniref:isochorismatase family protein n=1 Tax=Pseudoalteromonas sp. NBT06-2 TaxID=2025950 RepID=UPI00148286DB|nr:isochorismatase family protein [Pseudoalteromonas sp. NBT06-2]